MVNLTKRFFSLFVSVLLSSCARSIPTPSNSTQGFIASYYPPSNYKTFLDPVAIPSESLLELDALPGMDAVRARVRNFAVSYLALQGADLPNLQWGSAALSNTTRVAYLKQAVNGIPVANTAASVSFNLDDQVLTYSNSFVHVGHAGAPSAVPTVQWRDILPELENRFGATLLEEASLYYIAKSDGTLVLTHAIQLRNLDTAVWVEVFIDANTGKLVHVNDFAADASYTVVPIGKSSPLDGIDTIVDPADSYASPEGWHDQSAIFAGNNAIIYLGSKENPMNQTSLGVDYNFPYSPTQDPTSAVNQNAARTNAFYVANMVHDVAYRYGFTEDKFNFQANNFGKGGQEADPVVLTVQDSTHVNLAGRFITPPDGNSALGRVHIWESFDSKRDGALQNDILIHELAHGITNRLIGGGTARCLQETIAAGLGEGWADTFADWFQQNESRVHAYSFGSYVKNSGRGLRTFQYTTNQALNWYKYSHVARHTEPHRIGEIWATMLHTIQVNLSRFRPGGGDSKLVNPNSLEGPVVFMRILMESFSLMPCNPTFLDAKAAIYAADRALYEGRHRCLIATAFAERGFGQKADASFKDDDSLPDGCV